MPQASCNGQRNHGYLAFCGLSACAFFAWPIHLDEEIESLTPVPPRPLHRQLCRVLRVWRGGFVRCVLTCISPAAVNPFEHLTRLLDHSGAWVLLGGRSERSHRETCEGCIVSLTTPTRSSLKVSRSVSFLSLTEKASRVLAASYLLR